VGARVSNEKECGKALEPLLKELVLNSLGRYRRLESFISAHSF
jgi:hypothetical protein